MGGGWPAVPHWLYGSGHRSPLVLQQSCSLRHGQAYLAGGRSSARWRWAETGEVPAKVMVWTAAQCGAFLDSVEGQRLYASSTSPRTSGCAGRS